MPEFAVAVAFVWLAAYAPNRLARAVSTALVCVMLIVDVACWRLPALPDMYFDTYVAAFKALPPGRRSKSQSIRRVGHFKLTKKQSESTGWPARDLRVRWKMADNSATTWSTALLQRW